MKKYIFSLILISCIISSTYANAIYKKSAVASFYAEDFHGKKTSNGEIFNMWAMTCAHKMLPFGTILKVVNLSNGKWVEVRVNDRGPFVGTREIDLSKGAASKLGMIGKGTQKVRLEIVKLGKYTKDSVVTAKKACQMAGIKYYQVSMSSLEQTDVKKNESITVLETNVGDEKFSNAKKTVVRESGKRWDIQLGAFGSKDNAVNFGRKVKKDGFSNVATQTVVSKNIVRVVIKDIGTEEISEYESRLIAAGYENWTIRERKIN
ncbi:MAG: septal ring lytic transglycosylase RlpA family protein [Treponema sp.]|nr:septal ring lytic transglycosylase RlpA family protein [Candidatus Treponema merdequi]